MRNLFRVVGLNIYTFPHTLYQTLILKKKKDEENTAPQRDDVRRGRQKPYNEELMSYLPSLNIKRVLKTHEWAM